MSIYDLVAIGGGVTGLELGQVWSRLGAKMTVVEYLDRILPGMDGDLIAELVLAMTQKATVEQVARTCHAHPAMGEAVKEACLDALGRAIHA